MSSACSAVWVGEAGAFVAEHRQYPVTLLATETENFRLATRRPARMRRTQRLHRACGMGRRVGKVRFDQGARHLTPSRGVFTTDRPVPHVQLGVAEGLAAVTRRQRIRALP
jgi:hypothetical protein